MRYLPGLPDKEGSVMASGYNRAGSRAPMQWGPGPSAGFSAAPAASLYLPVDPDPRRPTVAGQRGDAGSLLRTVRDLIALRHAHPEFGPGGSLEILHDGYPLAYLRGGRFLVVVNPSSRACVLPPARPEFAGAAGVPLKLGLAGLHSARRGDDRVIYRIDDRERKIDVVAVEHCSDAYRPRQL